MGNKLCPSLSKGRRKNSFKLTQLDDPSRHARKRPAPQHAKASKYAFESPKRENTSADSPVNSKAPSIKIEENEEIVITINDATESNDNNTSKQIVCHENLGFESSSEEENSLAEAKTQSTELPTKIDQLAVQNLEDIRFRTTPDSSVASVRGSSNSDQFDDEIKGEIEEEEDENCVALNRTVRSIEEDIVTTATSNEIAEMTTKEDQFEDIMQKLEQMVNETTSLLEKTKYRESVHDDSLIAFMDFIKEHKDDESNQIISEIEKKENENREFSQSLNKQMAQQLADQDLSSADCWRLLSDHKKVVQDITKKRLEERQRLLGKLREKLKDRSDFREQRKEDEKMVEGAAKSIRSGEDGEKTENEGMEEAQDEQRTVTNSNQVAGEVVVHRQLSDETLSASSQSLSDESSSPVATKDGESAIEKENGTNEATERNQYSVSFNIQQDGVLKQDEKLEHLLELNTVNAICRENITKNDIATVLSNYQDERDRIGKLREAERYRVLESVQMKLMDKRTVVSMEMETIGEELEKMLRNSTDQTQIRELVRTQLQNL